MKKTINFVYITDQSLRNVEFEFSEGIHNHLAGWDKSSTLLQVRHRCVNVTFFIRRRSHIMMSHGVADKNYLLKRNKVGNLEVNKYDIVCVPGRWMKKKLLSHPDFELSEDQVRVVGWPRLDKLVDAQRQQERFVVPHNDGARPLKVLWAPTHGGGQRNGGDPISSYPHFEKHISDLNNMFDVSVSTHPHSRGGGKPTFEKLVEADVVIADQGTLVYEAWALGKPVVFPDWIVANGIKTKRGGSAEALIYEEKIGLHAADFSELVDMVRDAKGIDLTVKKFISEYIDANSLSRSYEKIALAAKDIWASGNLRLKPKNR